MAQGQGRSPPRAQPAPWAAGAVTAVNGIKGLWGLLAWLLGSSPVELLLLLKLLHDAILPLLDVV